MSTRNLNGDEFLNHTKSLCPFCEQQIEDESEHFSGPDKSNPGYSDCKYNEGTP